MKWLIDRVSWSMGMNASYKSGECCNYIYGLTSCIFSALVYICIGFLHLYKYNAWVWVSLNVDVIVTTIISFYFLSPLLFIQWKCYFLLFVCYHYYYYWQGYKVCKQYQILHFIVLFVMSVGSLLLHSNTVHNFNHSFNLFVQVQHICKYNV